MLSVIELRYLIQTDACTLYFYFNSSCVTVILVHRPVKLRAERRSHFAGFSFQLRWLLFVVLQSDEELHHKSHMNTAQCETCILVHLLIGWKTIHPYKVFAAQGFCEAISKASNIPAFMPEFCFELHFTVYTVINAVEWLWQADGPSLTNASIAPNFSSSTFFYRLGLVRSQKQ